MPISREFSGFSTVLQHRCSNCHAVVNLTPAGSIGVITAVGTTGLIFWGSILLLGKGAPDLLSALFYGAAILALMWVTVLPAFVNFKNPPTQSGEFTDVEFEETHDPIKRIVILAEKAGFLAGLLMPLIVIGAILSAAAIIGFINFTYFGN